MTEYTTLPDGCEEAVMLPSASVLGRVIGSLHDPAITGWDGSGTVEVLVKSEPRGASEDGQW